MVEAEDRIAIFRVEPKSGGACAIGECAVDNRGGARERLSPQGPRRPVLSGWCRISSSPSGRDCGSTAGPCNQDRNRRDETSRVQPLGTHDIIGLRRQVTIAQAGEPGRGASRESAQTAMARTRPSGLPAAVRPRRRAEARPSFRWR